MRFPVAVLMTAMGYAFAYWALTRVIACYQPGKTTAALSVPAPLMGVLLGVTRNTKAPLSTDRRETTKVPFSLGSQTSNGSVPVPIGGGQSNNGGGAQLSPNFPGGPGATIPTPSIPGGGALQA